MVDRSAYVIPPTSSRESALPSFSHPTHTAPATATATVWEKLGFTLLLVGVFVAGYYTIGLNADYSKTYSLRTPLDDLIPFLPQTIFLYFWVYTAMLYPAFTVRSRPLFRRVVLAYTIILATSLLVFAIFPVASVGFRPSVPLEKVTSFHYWGLKFNYAFDPPINLFPSLHLSIVTIAALSAWKAKRAFGLAGFVIVAAVAISICTVKQHFFIDGVVGILLAVAVYNFVLQPYSSRLEDSHSWRGPLAYFTLHGLVFLTFYLMFLAKLQPWSLMP